MSKFKTTQSVEDFLAKGGKITRFQPKSPTHKSDSIRSTSNGGPSIIVSMDDADLYYGEHKQRKAKKKITSMIDLSALPPELRKKYVDDVIYGEQEDEEDDE